MYQEKRGDVKGFLKQALTQHVYFCYKEVYMKYYVSITITLLGFFYAGFFSLALAADLTSALIQLDRTKASQQTGGMVCATPASTATEVTVSITFPAGFTVSTNATHWSASTTNLLSGSSAWPITGISAVSGQTVTYTTADLTAGTLYCFRFSNPLALKNPAMGNYEALLQTKDATSAVIDSAKIGLGIVANDQVTVTATVPANPSDYEFYLSASPVATTVENGTEIIYTISYRSNLSYSAPFTIVAGWDRGLISGSASYADVFQYVVGSATAASGTVPVVDTTQRTITWSIPSLAPSATLQTTTFALKISDTLNSSQTATSKVYADASSGGSPISTQNIPYVIKGVGTTAPAATPTATPAVTPGAPQRSLPRLAITSVALTEITSSYVSVHVTTNNSATLVIKYGKDPRALTKTLTLLNPATSHNITLTGLEANTTYYFTLTASDGLQTQTSELFTFKTAKRTNKVSLSPSNVVVIFKKIIVSDGVNNNIVVPHNSPVGIQIQISPDPVARLLSLSFKSKEVLGVSTLNNEEKNLSYQTTLVQLSPYAYSGELLTPLNFGAYELMVTVADAEGNLYTVPAPATFYISEPLKVLDRSSGKGIEGAVVTIEVLNQETKLYHPLQSSYALPTTTSEKGEFPIALPAADYRISVKALRYTSVEHLVSLGKSAFSFPTIVLERDYSFIEQAKYHLFTLEQTGRYLGKVLREYFSSTIARDATTVIVIVLLLIIAVFVYALQRLLRKLRKHTVKTEELSKQWAFIHGGLIAADVAFVVTILLAILFSVHLGVKEGAIFIAMAFVMLVFWLFCLYDVWSIEHEKR